MKNEIDKFVIRKEISPFKAIFHFCLYAFLWFYVFFVLIVNFAFLFGYYSDDFVSFYLLLNLNYGLYIKLIIGVVALIILTAIYSIFRLHHLRRLNSNVKKD